MTDELAPPPADAHGITWGVRASFVGYIRSLRDGVIECTGGASMTPGATFHFPFAGTNADEGEQWVLSSGEVYFEGHFGMMAVPLRNLALKVVPDAPATLCAEQEDGTFYPIADVTLGDPVTTETALVWEDAPVALTATGSEYFGSQYPAGTEMAPLRLSVPLA